MSVITLADAKKVYTYGEVIGQRFSIPIPRDREYTSPKERNGYEDQTFSSNDMPEAIEAECFGITKYSADGKMHPVCLASQNLIDKFWLQGIDGFSNGPDELNLICKVLGRQDGLMDVRSVNWEDTSIISREKLADWEGWLASRTTSVYPDGAHFYVRCVYDGNVDYYFMLYSDSDSFSAKLSVRPVFVLKSEISSLIHWVKS